MNQRGAENNNKENTEQGKTREVESSVMYTDLGSMFTYPPAARGLLPCMQPAVGPGGYAPQTQIFGTQEGENKPPCAITFHGEFLYDLTPE